MVQDFVDSIPSGSDGLLYEVKYADGKVAKANICLSADNAQLGDSIGAQLINQLAMKDEVGNPVATVVSQRDFYDSQMEYTHARVGTVHRLSPRFVPVQRTDYQGEPVAATSGRIRLVQFEVTADYVEADTFEVDGVATVAKMQGGGSELLDGFFVVGDLVSALLQTGEGSKLVFRAGGMPSIPSVFGDGIDGDLHIAAGETVVLPVPLPHRSIVEKQYNTIVIEEGGVLRCSGPNAGLILRCRKTCVINGTIDQSGMSPRTDVSNTYAYPADLVCGSSGTGGTGARYHSSGGVGGAPAMALRPYGGSYGTGGGGGSGESRSGGAGGGTSGIVFETVAFAGGAGGNRSNGAAGSHGGGGGGGASNYVDEIGGRGGSGAGGHGAAGGNSSGTGGGGGAGNAGGGVLLLYAGGACRLSGSVLCNGATGGNGGRGRALYQNNDWGFIAAGGGGGGGGGGGAIYIMYNTSLQNTAVLSASGGTGGSGGYSDCGNVPRAAGGQIGGNGTVTVKKFVKGMTM